MKVVIISIIIVLISIMSVAMILGFDSIGVVRYDTYFQPVIYKDFITDLSFAVSDFNADSSIIGITPNYEVGETYYLFEGYGVIIPEGQTLSEYFNINDSLTADLVPVSDTVVTVNSDKRLKAGLSPVPLYNDFRFLNNIRVTVRDIGGFFTATLYSYLGEQGYSVPLDVINIIQPFNSAVILNEYDKPVLENSEGGLNGIFKTLDFVFIEYPVYLYNYIDRYISFI